MRPTRPARAFLAEVLGRQGLCSTAAGDRPVARRSKLVDAFQGGRRAAVFVLSLKAGGTGLENLTWHPTSFISIDVEPRPSKPGHGSEFRIRTEGNVLVHKFVCRGTVEERIDLLIHVEARPFRATPRRNRGKSHPEMPTTAEILRMVLGSLDLRPRIGDS